MKAGKIIGKICLGALAVSLIPYRWKVDSEARTMEVRSLLLGVKKLPGAGKDHYAFAIPASGLDEDLTEKEAPEETVAPEEAPRADEPAE